MLRGDVLVWVDSATGGSVTTDRRVVVLVVDKGVKAWVWAAHVPKRDKRAICRSMVDVSVLLPMADRMFEGMRKERVDDSH